MADTTRAKNTDTPFVVGIAGGSASGKSSLAAALKDTLEAGAPARSAQILAMDSYARKDEDGAPKIVLAGEEMFDWNRPESFSTERLARDIDSICQAPAAPDVLMVEGLMVLHAVEIRRRLALKLFIELEPDERALRRMLRNMSAERGSQDPHFIAGYYRQSARIGHERYVEPSRVFADLIVRGDADFARIAPMIAAIIAKGLEKQSTS